MTPDLNQDTAPKPPRAPTAASTPTQRLGILALKLVLAGTMTGMTLGAIEIAGRALRIDFDKKQAALERMPIYYRLPTVPVGEAFFRRSGPATHTSRVLYEGLRQGGGADDAYGDEKPVTSSYDKDGFRNPDDLRDWEIAVAGDSCVELGYLTQEEMFTSRMAALLNCRVKNLGVSSTGTLSQSEYLRSYGKAPSTRQALVVWFEGNDLVDALSEENALLEARVYKKKPAPRDARLEPQSSFLKALWTRLRTPRPSPTTFTNGHYVFKGIKTPITDTYTPPGSAEISPGLRGIVEGGIEEWSTSARKLGVEPWLGFMPCKRRVLDGYLEFLPNAEPRLVQWKPNDLPQMIREICEAKGVRFVDLTPRLRRETEQGRLTYNGVRDTHVNRLGSDLVAETLADAMRPALAALGSGSGSQASLGEGKD